MQFVFNKYGNVLAERDLLFKSFYLSNNVSEARTSDCNQTFPFISSVLHHLLFGFSLDFFSFHSVAEHYRFVYFCLFLTQAKRVLLPSHHALLVLKWNTHRKMIPTWFN